MAAWTEAVERRQQMLGGAMLGLLAWVGFPRIEVAVDLVRAILLSP